MGFHPEAEREMREARAFAARLGPIHVRRLEAEFKRSLIGMLYFPSAWPPYLFGTRRCFLAGLPYFFVYRKRRRVEVVALAITGNGRGCGGGGCQKICQSIAG
ncbi:hypothetical protein OV079_06455 [Nannocystis pusilla]|uniref:Uncharacterized protein n=1 Tax=Nannocystis pusilla TaxID=889268 RepID=A0A9X3IWW7_9BACT|nr:hypothetical protein [Nannocystis pusilla]MCY1005218.1 hypothetical protein [Nannocystis pusilla]